MNKMFTAASILQLVKADKIYLGVPMATCLPTISTRTFFAH
jgi:CubicO group peptidase (beta-lactamase class C family)